jgi:hypothetical protein
MHNLMQTCCSILPSIEAKKKNMKSKKHWGSYNNYSLGTFRYTSYARHTLSADWLPTWSSSKKDNAYPSHNPMLDWGQLYQLHISVICPSSSHPYWNLPMTKIISMPLSTLTDSRHRRLSNVMSDKHLEK